MFAGLMRFANATGGEGFLKILKSMHLGDVLVLFFVFKFAGVKHIALGRPT